jgi:hypothetical protein
MFQNETEAAPVFHYETLFAASLNVFGKVFKKEVRSARPGLQDSPNS